KDGCGRGRFASTVAAGHDPGETMTRRLRILAAACALAGWPAPSHADWKPVERVEHYRVSGRSGIELYRSIGENGPLVGVGRAIAYTDFKLLWSRAYRPQADGSCTLASARPSLTITYRLPRAAGDLPAATK